MGYTRYWDHRKEIDLDFDFCKTGFRPYDLAVQCVLLIAKHHLQDRIQVDTGGSDYHWNDARCLCYAHLDYPLGEFLVDKEVGLIRRLESTD